MFTNRLKPIRVNGTPIQQNWLYLIKNLVVWVNGGLAPRILQFRTKEDWAINLMLVPLWTGVTDPDTHRIWRWVGPTS
jgi:hypothetical protein